MKAMSDVSIPLFYDPADYETAASTLDQLTAQQLWASYLIIAGRIAEIEHPAVTATSDQDGLLLTCPHCQASSREDDGYYLVDHESRWRPYRITRQDGGELVGEVGEGSPDRETLTDMCATCYRPVTLPQLTHQWW